MKGVSHIYNLCFGVSFLATHVLQLVNNILLAPCVTCDLCQVRLVRPGAAGPGALAGGRLRLHGRRGRRDSQGAGSRAEIPCFMLPKFCSVFYYFGNIFLIL